MDSNQMDEKSTPIANLNNKSSDDADVVNNILKKYSTLENQPTVQQLETKFEDRNLNEEIYNISSDNTAFKEHQQKELQRLNKVNKPKEDEYEEDIIDDDEDEYIEYEIEEQPLWRRVLNEIRIPIFIFILALVFFNCSFDKIIVQRIPLLGNQFNECNTYGFLLKAFLISVFSYLFIRFVRI